MIYILILSKSFGWNCYLASQVSLTKETVQGKVTTGKEWHQYSFHSKKQSLNPPLGTSGKKKSHLHFGYLFYSSMITNKVGVHKMSKHHKNWTWGVVWWGSGERWPLTEHEVWREGDVRQRDAHTHNASHNTHYTLFPSHTIEYILPFGYDCHSMHISPINPHIRKKIAPENLAEALKWSQNKDWKFSFLLRHCVCSIFQSTFFQLICIIIWLVHASWQTYPVLLISNVGVYLWHTAREKL